jgi:hypothetical protein
VEDRHGEDDAEGCDEEVYEVAEEDEEGERVRDGRVDVPEKRGLGLSPELEGCSGWRVCSSRAKQGWVGGLRGSHQTTKISHLVEGATSLCSQS